MKKDKKTSILIVLLLLVTVSIGYAAISRNYNFNGFINIKGNKWNLTPPTTGEIEEEPADPSNPPEITTDPDTGDVTIKYRATLEKPGDVYSLVVPIKNDGTMDAVLQTVTTTPLTADQQKYLTYTITAEDGSALQGKELASKGTPLKVKVIVKYNDDDPKNIPENDVSNIELKTILSFAQKS